MKKTRFDIYVSAHAAAVNSFDQSTPLAVEKSALAAFEADQNNPLDFAIWKQTFDNLRQQFASLKNQPAPSAGVTSAVAKPATTSAVVPK